MAARILKSLPKDSKDDGRTYFFHCEVKANNEDGFRVIKRMVIADSSEEAAEAARELVRGLKKKETISYADLEDPKANRVLCLRKDDIARLR